jgi:hypothetical protein
MTSKPCGRAYAILHCTNPKGQKVLRTKVAEERLFANVEPMLDLLVERSPVKILSDKGLTLDLRQKLLAATVQGGERFFVEAKSERLDNRATASIECPLDAEVFYKHRHRGRTLG